MTPELIPPVERITITRAKLARSPLATGPGPAWTWLYTVTTKGFYTASGTLEECRTIAKRRRAETGLDISEDWERTK